jgi:hypothetical protein
LFRIRNTLTTFNFLLFAIRLTSNLQMQAREPGLGAAVSGGGDDLLARSLMT